MGTHRQDGDNRQNHRVEPFSPALYAKRLVSDWPDPTPETLDTLREALLPVARIIRARDPQGGRA